MLSVVSESPRRRIRHEPGRMWLARPARPLVRPPQTDQPIADLTEVVWRRACSGSCLVRCSFPAVPGINNRQPMTPAGGAASDMSVAAGVGSDAAGRRGCGRVVRPGVAGVTAAQFRADLRVARPPERREVAGHRHRATRR